MSWAARLWQDLQPAPGRLGITLRIVLATLVALLLMMVLQLPSAALGLYLIFLISRESPAVGLKGGLMSLLSLALAVAGSLAVVIVSDNDPAIRLLSVAIAAYLAGSLMAASTIGPLASIWGFIYCTVIAFWERPAPADTIVKSSLYLIATVSLAFVCTTCVEYVFAFRHAADRLDDAINMRFRMVERVYAMFAQGAGDANVSDAVTQLNRMAAIGQRPMLELYAQALSRGHSEREHRVSRGSIAFLAQLLDNAAAFASANSGGVNDAAVRARCAEIARLCRERPRIRPTEQLRAPAKPGLLDRVEEAMQLVLEAPDASASDHTAEILPTEETPLIIPGAFFAKDTVFYALKITLCVMICYVFYFAVGWPGISTSVTTVFITALGTSGAIKQKLFNRFIGSAIGGALAIGATVFLFPYMDSITSLVILVASVALLAAWWACGRQFGYAGLQIAFAFYLVAFEGQSAPRDLSPHGGGDAADAGEHSARRVPAAADFRQPSGTAAEAATGGRAARAAGKSIRRTAHPERQRAL